MRRLLAAATLIAALLGPAAVADAACTKTWLLTNTAGTWSTGANWSGSTSPAATDDVCIPAGSGQITFDPASASVRSLQLARTMLVGGSTTLTVTGGGTQDSDLQLGADITGSGTLDFDATATLNKSGNDTVELHPELDLDGPVNINAGTLTFTGGSDSVNTYAGTFTLAGGTTMSVGANGFGNHTFAGTVTDGANAATVTSATGNVVNFDGTYAVDTTTISGNVNLNGTTSMQTLNLLAANLGGSASYTVAGALNWAGGTYGGSGTTTVPSGATIDLQPGTTKQLTRPILNDSTTAVVVDVADFQIGTGGVLDNRSGSTFRLVGDNDVGGNGNGQLRGRAGGTVQKQTAGTSELAPASDFDGPVNVDAGTLQLGTAHSIDSHAGTFTLANGTTLGMGGSGFGTHVFGGTITDGANQATVTNNSGNNPDINGTLDVHTLTNSGNLSLDGPTTLAVLNHSGGNLTGTDDYTISEAFNWSAGPYGGSGTTTIPSGGSIDFQTAGSKQLSRTILNDATAAVAVDVTGLSVITGGVIDNRSGSTFRLVGDNDVAGSSDGQLRSRAGATVEKQSAGTSEITPDNDFDGPVDVDAGTLDLGTSGTIDSHAGTFTLAGGTTLGIGGSGFGNHTFGGTITDGANQATVRNTSGNQSTVNGTLDVHTLTNSGNLALNGATTLAVLDLDGGILSGSDDYSVSQTLDWAGGVLSGTGTTTIPAAATVAFSSAAGKQVQSSRVLRNETTTFQPPADATFSIQAGGRLDNAGTITLPSDGHDIGGGGPLHNLAGATIQKTGGAGGAAHSHLPLSVNAGTVNVAQGTMQSTANGLANTGTLTVPAGRRFDLSGTITQTAGTIRGGGTLGANVTNNGGTVQPGDSAGTMTLTADYTQGDAGTLLVEVNGTTPGTQFDVLSVGGQASLDGDVQVDLGFNPANADVFQFLTSGSRTGAFDDVTGDDPSGGRVFSLDYPVANPFGARLVIDLPAPPTAGTPAITGTPEPGQTLTCETGTWGGNPAFAFQWLLNGQPIGGADQQTYVVAEGDREKQLACRVTGSNGAGSDEATSAPVSVPAAPAPPAPPAPPDPPAATTSTPPASPAPAPPVARASAPAPTPQENRLASSSPAAVAQALGLPPARACLSRRRFAIRLSQPRGVRLRSARVTVNGRTTTARRVRGRLTATVDLRGLRRGRFSVTIVAVTESGRTLRGSRRYRTCAPKRQRGR